MPKCVEIYSNNGGKEGREEGKRESAKLKLGSRELRASAIRRTTMVRLKLREVLAHGLGGCMWSVPVALI